MAITLTQLRSFIAVAEAGSVREAARLLHVSQPSVSAAVAALAREVGAPLLDRDGRGVRLSRAGEAFLPLARDALGTLDAGCRAAREAAGAERATLRIAAVTTAGEHVLPPLLRAFCSAHPDVAVALEVGNKETVLARLLAHEADVAIGGRAPRGEGVSGRAFAPNEHAVVARAGHPLAGRRGVPVSALGQETWLVREPGSGTRDVVEGFLGEHGLSPRVTTIGSNGAIREAAAAGLGVAVVPVDAVRDALAAGTLARLDVLPPPPRREWHVLTRASGARPPAQAFVAFLTNRRMANSQS